MLSINPKDIPTVKLQAYLQTAISPRPIALASTISKDNLPNLSPFSFFNVFSANPPILIFSPARRVRDNTIKHTLINAKDTKEVVISVVNYNMVQQVSLSSTEYPEGVNEFEKAGFNMMPSEIVKPFLIAESPVQFECKVQQIIPLGENAGAGNLIICEIVIMHINEDVLDENNNISQHKIDLVSRLGANWYSRVNAGLFEVEKPLATLGIGVDNIPEFIKNYSIFTGNDLGKLGNIENIPTQEEIATFVKENFKIKAVLSADDFDKKMQLAKELLDDNQVLNAWKVLLAEK